MIYCAIILAALVAAFGIVWRMANDMAAIDDERTQ